MPQRTTWEIYEIQHCRGPGCPVRERYQFVDGHGRRRHFSTKVRAKVERDKAKALFTQEGKLAAGMGEQHRRDAAQAIGLLPAGWTLTRCAQFVADHVKRTTQVLSIEEALNRFLTTKEKTSDYHANDLARRLKRWAEIRDPTHPIHAVTKQEVESYLTQYSAQNFINHRAALSNLFGYAFKIGATPDNPLLTIEKPRIKRARPAVLNDDEFERRCLIALALREGLVDFISWLVLGGLVGLRPYEVLRLEWTEFPFRRAKSVSNQDGRKHTSANRSIAAQCF